MVEKSFLTFLVCLFSYCGQPFDVVSSSVQIFQAGRVESGGGINYELVIVAKKSSKKLHFESLELKGEKLLMKMHKTNNNFIEEFHRGDTIILKATKKLSSEKMELANQLNTEYLLLNYSFKDKENVARLKPEIKERLSFP